MVEKKTTQFKLGILKTYIHLFKGNFITKINETDNILFIYREDDSEEAWNFALLKNSVNADEIRKIERFFGDKNRKSSIYFPDEPKFKSLRTNLEKENYKINGRDYWMFWNKEIPEIDESGIKEVKTEEEFNIWIETFLKSYVKDDPKNPYGEQPGFAASLKKFWKRGIIKDKFFIAFDRNFPVAVGALASGDRKGYIYAIGSTLQSRDKGFGKRISLYCVRESFKQGNKIHFLATEKGHYPFEFYKRIGFDPEFSSSFYTKY